MLVKRGRWYYTRIMFKGKLYQKALHTQDPKEAVKLEAVFRASLVREEFEQMLATSLPNRRTRATFSLTSQHLKRFERLATQTGITVAEHVRRALDSYLESGSTPSERTSCTRSGNVEN